MPDLEPASALAMRIYGECCYLVSDSLFFEQEKARQLIEADRAAVAAIRESQIAELRAVLFDAEHHIASLEAQLASARDEALREAMRVVFRTVHPDEKGPPSFVTGKQECLDALDALAAEKEPHGR